MSSEWDNPSIERRSNPVAKLFKAVWAWHVLTKIGIFFLILGTINALSAEDLGRAGAGTRLFYGVALVFLGVWRKRRTTSRRKRRTASRGILG